MRSLAIYIATLGVISVYSIPVQAGCFSLGKKCPPTTCAPACDPVQSCSTDMPSQLNIMMTQEILDLRDQVNALAEQKAEAEEALQLAQKKLEEQSQQTKRLAADNKKLKSDLESVNNQLAQQKKQTQKSNQALQAEKKKAAMLVSKNNELEQSVAQAQKRVQQLKKQAQKSQPANNNKKKKKPEEKAISESKEDQKPKGGQAKEGDPEAGSA